MHKHSFKMNTVTNVHGIEMWKKHTISGSSMHFSSFVLLNSTVIVIKPSWSLPSKFVVQSFIDISRRPALTPSVTSTWCDGPIKVYIYICNTIKINTQALSTASFVRHVVPCEHHTWLLTSKLLVSWNI